MNNSIQNYLNKDKNFCTGCRSCFMSCSQSAILMKDDREGFWYPEVDIPKCINCGICIKKCPILNPVNIEKINAKRYAMILKDKTLLKKSSSGGAYGGIASYFLSVGGIVYGAAYDDVLNVNIECVSDHSALYRVQGSKYVSCSTENTFEDVKNNLNLGKTVLYGASPCHIAGLYAYLGKDYKDLYTMDLICHGTPSRKLFQKYLAWLGSRLHGEIKYYGFRDKDIAGWSCGGRTIAKTKSRSKIFHGVCDPYYSAFVRCETYRESCYRCPFAISSGRVGDLSVGDFWATDYEYPYIEKKDGISFCSVNTEKGIMLFNKIKKYFDTYECPDNETLRVNVAYSRATPRPKVRDSIYEHIDSIDLNRYFKKFSYLNPFIYELRKYVSSRCPKVIKKIIKLVINRK